MQFSLIAIVNRGEAAMRLIHAVRDLNAAGAGPFRTVALHTEGERQAMFVRESDFSYDLGPAAARPYLDLAVLERALVETGADAVWPGWGFVAEDPTFVDLCDRLGITFIGPSAEAMRQLGDKIGSKLIAEKVGVAVAPWSRGPVATLEEALASAELVGYPLMLKATAGGGGRGIRMVASVADLEDAYQRTRDEAARAFGNGTVFLERLVTGARHVEVQVIADTHGTAWALGVRDCSIQRRNQKVIEESSSPLLTREQTDELKESAERLALAVGYVGAGTVEFLYHPGERSFAFLEVNTRLQVEHSITEVTTDLDLVKAQLHVASGGRLEGAKPVEKGHAVEARLNAEDPDRDFAPAPGRIARLELPTGPGIRVDTGVAEGDTIPSDFDSMIAKVIAYGATREEALARLRRAMKATTVVIEGGASNKSFVLDLLDQPEVVDGTGGWADTSWIDRVRGQGRLAAQRHAGLAVVTAAIEAYVDELQIEVARLLETAHGGRPQAQHRAGRPVELKLRGTTYQVSTINTGPSSYRVTVASGSIEETVDVELEVIDAYHRRLVIGGQRHPVVTATHGPSTLVEVDGVAHRVSRDEGGVLRSPAPALVVATPVAVGDEVEAGAPVLVLESMKMETVLTAPFAARVKELLVMTGGQVETGTPLVRLEPLGDGTEETAAEVTGPSLDLPHPEIGQTPAIRAARARAALTAVVLGYDVPPQDSGGALAAYLTARDELVAEGTSVVADEMALLGTFADLAELSRNRPADEERQTELRVHSSREHFHTYLQSLDVERGGLPEHFHDRLLRVLQHYGVHDLERTPALEEAVFRIFLAQQRAAPEVALASAVLGRWSDEPTPAGHLAEVRGLLERLGRATQLRFPVIGDLARSVRFRWFDQPPVDEDRAGVLTGVRAELAALAADDDLPDRAERIEALAAIPEQIVRFLAERLEHGVLTHEPMLEVLVRRHYRDFDLTDLRSLDLSGRPFVVADYTLDDRPTQLVSTVGTVTELSDPTGPLAASVAARVAERRDGSDAVVDLYLSWPEAPESADTVSAELRELVRALPFAHEVRRVCIGVCAGGDRPVGYYAFRPTDDGDVAEDDLTRGVHPMVGRRLNLWRLRNFHLTRIEAPEDVLLYECVARENPADRRLVALAQVRQLAVVRDEEGNVVALPHAERAVENCLEAIRRARVARGAAGAKLDMNHVWIQVWPVVEVDAAGLTSLGNKIRPLTDGAGIEEVLAQGRVAVPDGDPVLVTVRFGAQPGAGVVSSVEAPPTELLKPLDDYASKVLRARRRGLVYPYELEAVLAGPGGTLVEHDLDETGALVPVDRPRGLNTAAILAAVVTTPTALQPEGVTRVVLCGDPTKSLGSVSEPECRRISAALDLAERMQVPVEWFALSAGARISMDSGTENMDWVASALRRIVEFTQRGGEINVVVAGINVGAQPYWNAEATMLMHTKGILVMTPDSAMVLTGKQSLDFSGGVSAEDNYGIGGYDRVMGPNGQAQYWAPDLAGAFRVLMAHYEHTYVVPGEERPRQAATSDPVDRDVSPYPHTAEGSDFQTVGEIFSATSNPDRKKAFDIRTVMAALADQDHPTLERWAGMADADTSVVLDAHLGGHPVTILGIESRPIRRRGFPPTDGPDTYTAGTLFPRSSKKAARAINAASGNRPLVVLANLSGFDGSPDSMRNLQLEYGAEIGRAIVNFDGPIVFCVISRYHGGAFVVFSKALNPNMTVLALEGSFASVIGGAPAAAVVFTGEVDKRTASSPAMHALDVRIAEAQGSERSRLVVEQAELRAATRAEKISEVAAEFDGIHNIHRAVEVGSVDKVIAAADLRPEIIAVVEEAARRRGA
ncbi:fused acetyl/propionyl-CoA carboxylase subunit alpha/methylmalonyl-CoA decarboxylase subunit alpha [Nocardioides psychrotolerans]|uniref:Acetyl/propionyl-CoA carboxylase, alpha subunit n=1 Tax=Nocardioides psychrotolerans TaxID=1005945 RepID=A0A1I3QMF2_9ACTN|nr:carboxyl transferase domain-containing protein [Nocardioides psychrotolerans]GEP40164.1 fused acetyl/propionyl-CoA carboxylase subunit alpha/methylmalonyl-CoA decarboxylase subunit alpha [Nocardioides psychrotolerans]SFJ34709.1 Acetyl/propionyl-CoA carboxylase, alpha subunit [Nocardioides psychrotolerans]